jgi:transcriptional antiterminator NusG
MFVITEDIYALYEALREIPYFTKVLGDPQCLLPLSDGEVAFLKRFGGKEHVTEISIGVVEQDHVRITEGPLAGMEGCITRINRHKRIAKIQVELFGQPIEATVGLEVVEKTSGQIS